MHYSLLHQQRQFLPLHFGQESQQGLDFGGSRSGPVPRCVCRV